jgi:hypothetical protein
MYLVACSLLNIPFLRGRAKCYHNRYFETISQLGVNRNPRGSFIYSGWNREMKLQRRDPLFQDCLAEILWVAARSGTVMVVSEFRSISLSLRSIAYRASSSRFEVPTLLKILNK